MIRLSDILSKVEAYHPTADGDLIKKAYVYAARAHDGQTRRSGDPYVVHPLSVASIITDLRLDVPSICAGLLHDCVEDTSSTVEELQALFGQEVAFLVDGVTKLGKIAWTTREERQATAPASRARSSTTPPGRSSAGPPTGTARPTRPSSPRSRSPPPTASTTSRP